MQRPSGVVEPLAGFDFAAAALPIELVDPDEADAPPSTRPPSATNACKALNEQPGRHHTWVVGAIGNDGSRSLGSAPAGAL
jgi:hypothetical protein